MNKWKDKQKNNSRELGAAVGLLTNGVGDAATLSAAAPEVCHQLMQCRRLVDLPPELSLDPLFEEPFPATGASAQRFSICIRRETLDERPAPPFDPFEPLEATLGEPFEPALELPFDPVLDPGLFGCLSPVFEPPDAVETIWLRRCITRRT